MLINSIDFIIEVVFKLLDIIVQMQCLFKYILTWIFDPIQDRYLTAVDISVPLSQWRSYIVDSIITIRILGTTIYWDITLTECRRKCLFGSFDGTDIRTRRISLWILNYLRQLILLVFLLASYFNDRFIIIKNDCFPISLFINTSIAFILLMTF